MNAARPRATAVQVTVVFLPRALVGRVLEALRLRPAAVAGAPVLLAREEAAVPQEEGADLALLEADVPHRGRPCPHQVAHRLVGGVRDPDRGQLAGAQEPGQAERAAAVGLDPVARLP